MYKNVFYYSHLTPIGGIETWLWNIAKKYGDTHDITVLYSFADRGQLHRLQRLVRCERFTGQPIQCKRVFVCYDAADFLNHVQAEEYCLVVHGDYVALGYPAPQLPKITKVLGVSQVVCDSYRKQTGREIELCYNPQTPIKARKVLRLVSATRMAPEKAPDRFKILADALDAAQVPFTWEIYTDSRAVFDNPSVSWKRSRLDVIDFIAAADYLVQPSVTEGEPYSLNEALSVGTPVIVTDYPAAHEMGVKNGVNGFILPQNMENIPVDAIVKGLKKFKYAPPADRWGELLEPGKGTYLDEIGDGVDVECVATYFDTQRKVQVAPGEIFRVSEERAETLFKNKVAIRCPEA
ncbi:MAG: glycosyltransferase [Clostridia bacterium]|nr:glycosyltransferase [Clostridia bacterium]MBQ6359415.1 glycosyltransferase [Clostridia bacterium]MBR0205969.1 glycosyltransferase [Clostridia bacterium]